MYAVIRSAPSAAAGRARVGAAAAAAVVGGVEQVGCHVGGFEELDVEAEPSVVPGISTEVVMLMYFLLRSR